MKIRYLFEKLSFSYKSTILIFIISGGMMSIILLSQLSIYVIKNDFDILFEKRTKTIIKLINIKNTYKINIYDTLKDLHNGYLTYNQANEVILLGEQLVQKNWSVYKNTVDDKDNDLSLILKFIKIIFKDNKENKYILKKHIISSIDKKSLSINNDIEKIMNLFKNSNNPSILINKLYLKINSLDIYISNLTILDTKLAIEEKRITQKKFETMTFMFNILIIGIFIISVLFTFGLLRYFNKLNLYLENSVNEKTKKLTEINSYLEIKVKKEVENSRKKDMLLYQQAKLASLGEMLNNIAHQWRQPLGALSMIIQSFQSKMEVGKLTYSMVQEKVKDAMYLSKNMSNTLEDFQNFFNPNKDKTYFLISECINHTLELTKYLIDKENIEMNIEIQDDMKVYSFYNELSHVVLNLISNSKDALMDKDYKKIIKIQIKKSNENIKINIIDNGGGINDEILPKIFDPYYTTKHKSAGTGIGLYMSKQIIEKHMCGIIKATNIYYKINSKNSENCTLFTLIIPIKNTCI
jgi:signal transduction histidine kinase